MSQTIFVLEDDADISRLVQYHLESAGFTVRPYLAINQILTDAERLDDGPIALDVLVRSWSHSRDAIAIRWDDVAGPVAISLTGVQD